MDTVQAVILGIVQGLTEFLPVSSTGHLLLTEWFLGLSPETFGLTFDAALHLGTLAALLVVFWRDYLAQAVGLMGLLTRKTGLNDPATVLALALVIGTVPAVVAGLLLEDLIATAFRSPLLVAATLFLFSGVLLWVERAGLRSRSVADVHWRDAFLIGCAQAVALVPGVSRSGITIAAGMALGLRREEAARFAFLLSAPVIAGAGGKQLLDVVRQGDTGAFLPLVAGVATSAVVGYAVIRFLLRYLASHSLDVFVAYRVVLAGVVVLAYVNGAGS